MSKLSEKETWRRIRSYQMSPEQIIDAVKERCQKQNVRELYLFGSYAAGNPTPTSDMDFVVKGCRDINALEESMDQIMTLTTIDIFDYDHITNPNLKKDIDQYAKKIY